MQESNEEKESAFPTKPPQLLSVDPSQQEHEEHDMNISVKFVDGKITEIGVTSTEQGEDTPQLKREVYIFLIILLYHAIITPPKGIGRPCFN